MTSQCKAVGKNFKKSNLRIHNSIIYPLESKELNKCHFHTIEEKVVQAYRPMPSGLSLQ